MLKKFLLALIYIAFLSLISHAQVLHYSQFYLSPTTTNAAHIGAYNGTARIGGIHRSQWLGLEERGINTTSLYIDAPIYRGIRERDWIGISIGMNNDIFGIGRLNLTGVNVGLAYHFALDKEQLSKISIGGIANLMSLNVDGDDLLWEDQIRSNATSQDALRLNSFESQSTSQFQIGINWQQRISDNLGFNIGYGIQNLTESEYSFYVLPDSIEAEASPSYSTISGELYLDATDKLRLAPLFLIQNYNAESEMLIGVTAYSSLAKSQTRKLQYGMAYRLQDALIFYLGLMDENYRLGLSFDYTVSDLSDYSPVNFEIGGYYIIKKYKLPQANPILFCPRF